MKNQSQIRFRLALANFQHTFRISANEILKRHNNLPEILMRIPSNVLLIITETTAALTHNHKLWKNLPHDLTNGFIFIAMMQDGGNAVDTLINGIGAVS